MEVFGGPVVMEEVSVSTIESVPRPAARGRSFGEITWAGQFVPFIHEDEATYHGNTSRNASFYPARMWRVGQRYNLVVVT